jgi:hypothetical protein
VFAGKSISIRSNERPGVVSAGGRVEEPQLTWMTDRRIGAVCQGIRGE